MMKKLLPLTAIAIGALFSAQASASTGSIASTATITPDTTGSNPNLCEALSNDITVQISDGVVAAWNCSTTSFTAATCHTTGTNKQQTIDCTYTEDKDDSGNGLGTYTASSVNCPTYTGTGEAPTSASFQGRIGFKGSSAGGRVAAVELADTTVCTTSTVETLVPTP